MNPVVVSDISIVLLRSHKKTQDNLGIFYWYTTDKKVYTQLKQEGRRWREILDPMYRSYKLQIQSRD